MDASCKNTGILLTLRSVVHIQVLRTKLWAKRLTSEAESESYISRQLHTFIYIYGIIVVVRSQASHSQRLST